MENVMMLMGFGIAALVACVTVVLLQKNGNELKKKDKLIVEKEAEIGRLTEQLASVSTERDEKGAALAKFEQEFEDRVDEIVQSSIEKISHAEETKEEAVRAAQDNYEAAAAVHALLKEKEELIHQLQRKIAG
jgi:phenylalanyl-tRNA synthetase alpha subunit